MWKNERRTIKYVEVFSTLLLFEVRIPTNSVSVPLSGPTSNCKGLVVLSVTSHTEDVLENQSTVQSESPGDEDPSPVIRVPP